MTDLRDQLVRLLDGEPEPPYDIEQIVRSGRRARRRHHAAVAAVGTLGAAGVAAAVVLPGLAAGSNDESISLGVQPSSTASPTTGKCYIAAAPPSAVKRTVHRLIESGRVGTDPSVTVVKRGKGGDRTLIEVCAEGASPMVPRQKQQSADKPPTGPRYHYTEKPEEIAARLGAHLRDRVTGFGLSISFTRPFSQESSTLDDGRPAYYGGNVDVREDSGYADIGVQVRHTVTELVPFTGECTAAEHCTETKLPDGGVLRTGQVEAGRGDVVLTAEVHRPDGVVVQAQESNYPFGPDAGSQPHGDQPLTLDQLVALAKDDAFTF